MRKVLFGLLLTSFVLMLSFYGEAAKDESLVLYLPLNEGKGEEVKDLSGNENHGKLVGNPEWVKGNHGSALKFSGESNEDHVEVPDSPSLNPEKEVTCMAWLYFDKWHPTGGVISKYVGAGAQRSYDIYMHHSQNLSFTGACCIKGDQCTALHTPEEALAEKKWQHVALTFKAEDSMKLYVNGEMVAESKVVIDHLFDNNVPLYVGTDFAPGGAHSGQPREFTGIIDEVAVFNKALSDTEIKKKMETILAVEPEGKLATLWGALKTQ